MNYGPHGIKSEAHRPVVMSRRGNGLLRASAGIAGRRAASSRRVAMRWMRRLRLPPR